MTGVGFHEEMMILIGDRQVADLTINSQEEATFVTRLRAPLADKMSKRLIPLAIPPSNWDSPIQTNWRSMKFHRAGTS